MIEQVLVFDAVVPNVSQNAELLVVDLRVLVEVHRGHHRRLLVEHELGVKVLQEPDVAVGKALQPFVGVPVHARLPVYHGQPDSPPDGRADGVAQLVVELEERAYDDEVLPRVLADVSYAHVNGVGVQDRDHARA